MNNLISYIVSVVGIASFIAGAIGYVILAPKLSNPKDQWLKKSLIASCIGMLGLFVWIITMDSYDLVNELASHDLSGISNSLWSILVIIILALILLTIGTYVKMLMLVDYDKSLQLLIKKLRDRRK